MRRYVPLILIVIVLIAPFALRRAMVTGSAQSSDNSSLRLVILTPHVEGIRREFADAFDAWHRERFGQGVFIDYRNYGGASEIVRFFKSSEPLYRSLGTYKIDLVWGGGDYLFDEQLKKPGYLEPVRLRAEVMRNAFPSRTLNGANLYDASDPPCWFGTALSAFGILYNKDVYRQVGAPIPKSWRDLADARLHGWLVAADPTRSATARYLFMIIVERAMIDAVAQGRTEDQGWAEGMGLVRLMCSNARYFTDAGSAVPNVVSTGDVGVGMAIDFFGRAQVDAVHDDRLGYVEPIGETIVNADPIGIVRGTEHKELAARFIEFVLSDRGQRLWITRAGAPGGPKHTSLRRLPVVAGVYRDKSNFTDDADPFDARFAFESHASRKRTFAFIGELIEVSCMELLDELRETRRAIEVVQDPVRREHLRARLGTFPYPQAEALAQQAIYFDKNATSIQQLRMKRELTESFRDEYRALREEASR